ncbi:DUF2225 domain-containing protein [Clostridium manihotivorum]|uniref:DUF2225 domain-containing protein n=1 Tax=Clostridium manihotivorum TaxID=2320868 RepID=A0A410E036_9CLOT|nr:DUF2225 domain-containing protein [Clostridium manihotivorum]QAA34663.1 DUF2225 domain-containing protein [Clostridium manihotivorum]
MDKIFSGLENLGFDNLNNIDLYKKEDKSTGSVLKSKEIDPASFLYDRECFCPVCETKFKARSTKTNGPRVQSKDSDLFIRYSVVNPYFYDVVVCPTCGYSAMKADFDKLKSYQIESIVKGVSTKWNRKNYPPIYDEKIAIERYKLALINSVVMDGKISTKAMICLKIGWMYRLLEDTSNEKAFLAKAVEGFDKAYISEDFPIYGMNRFSLMYLIGELYRRIDQNDLALQWFSKVITSIQCPQKVKDMARDMKDLIKAENL